MIDIMTAHRAKAALALRRKRDRLFGPQLFGEPAWEILLELYVAAATGRPLQISGVLPISTTAPTTALRYFDALGRAGFIQREQDPADRRRVWLQLTPEGAALVHKVLNE